MDKTKSNHKIKAGQKNALPFYFGAQVASRLQSTCSACVAFYLGGI